MPRSDMKGHFPVYSWSTGSWKWTVRRNLWGMIPCLMTKDTRGNSRFFQRKVVYRRITAGKSK